MTPYIMYFAIVVCFLILYRNIFRQSDREGKFIVVSLCVLWPISIVMAIAFLFSDD
jgi:Ca2+/Na+ antiporter